MTTQPDNTNLTPSSDALSVAAPPDATEVQEWLQHGQGLATRVFDGTVREAVGFKVGIGGVQRQNGSCQRWVTAEAGSLLGGPFERELVRQLAAVLTASADEIERYR
jgi:hypothetical protein